MSGSDTRDIDAIIDLGRRVEATGLVPWCDVMLGIDALGNEERAGDNVAAFLQYKHGLHGFCFPVLDDLATLACVRDAAMEAWDSLGPGFSQFDIMHGSGWAGGFGWLVRIVVDGRPWKFEADTLGEALTMSLEARAVLP
jgi:hypothetical protein